MKQLKQHTSTRRYQMLSEKPDNTETASQNRIKPMLLTDGKDYRCSQCRQRLTEDAKSCPICKAVFEGTATIVKKVAAIPGSQEYLDQLEQRYNKLREEMGEEDFNRFLEKKRIMMENHAKKKAATEKKGAGSERTFIWVLLGAAIVILLLLLSKRMGFPSII